MPVIARDSFAAGNLVYAWPFPIGPECEISCSEDEQVVMCPAWTVGERLGPGRHRWRSPDPSRPVAAYFVSFGAVDVEFDMITRFALPVTGQPIWIRASGSVLVRCSDPGVLVAQFIGLPFDALDEGVRRSVARSVERMAARLLTRRVVLAGTIKAITEPSLLPEIAAELASYNPTAGAVFGIELAQVSRLYLEANDGTVTESSPPASRPDLRPPPEQMPVYQAPTGQYPMFHHGEPAPVGAPMYAVPSSQPPGAAPLPAPERAGSPPYAGERASSPSYSPPERAASQPPVSFDPQPPVSVSEPSIIVNGWEEPAPPPAPAAAMPVPPAPVPEPVGRHDTLRGMAALNPSTAAAAARAPGAAAKPPPIPPRRSSISETLPPPMPPIPAPARPATAPPAAEGSSPANPRLASEPSPAAAAPEARGSILAIGARIGESPVSSGSVTSGEILAKVAPGKRVLVPGPHGLMQSATVRQLLSGYYELEVGSSGETIWVPMAHVVPE